MNFGNIYERVERFPIGAVATFLGAATLSNAYASLNFAFIRHIFMIVGAVVILLNLMKIALHKETFKKECNNTIPASLFGTLLMLITIFGSYLFPYNQSLGKIIWSAGVILHALLIIFFTYNHLIKKFDIKFFIPSWFVVYNGIMVGVVVGNGMIEPSIAKVITYYGILIFFIILPFMVKRVLQTPLPVELMHTKTIFLAPISLCIITYLNITKEININFIFLLYGILIIALIMVLKNLPRFFSVSFTPIFGALTFPMAIGTVASLRMSAFLKGSDYATFHPIVFNIAIFQLLLATAIIGYVIFNFLKKVNCKS